jgi:hypothetical protein
MMEAICCPETSVLTRAARRNIPEKAFFMKMLFVEIILDAGFCGQTDLQYGKFVISEFRHYLATIYNAVITSYKT